MTVLSVNVNKFALLRNARGRNFPDVAAIVTQLVELGVKGITVHPRPDERHITRTDVRILSELLKQYPEVEFNIEGYPSEEFLALVLAASPDQCTLVPDKPEQLTSDHGWDVLAQQKLLEEVLGTLRQAKIRSSLFIDPDIDAITSVLAVGADRIELYTEEYASAFGSSRQGQVWERYRVAAAHAHSLGLGINAGHDLNLQNLSEFLQIPDIEEVSIGHALVVEAIQQGLSQVVNKYKAITDT